ncbi:MAG: hypothetical protein ACFBWO_15270 [Paracoccaceae bacterium]
MSLIGRFTGRAGATTPSPMLAYLAERGLADSEETVARFKGYFRELRAARAALGSRCDARAPERTRECGDTPPPRTSSSRTPLWSIRAFEAARTLIGEATETLGAGTRALGDEVARAPGGEATRDALRAFEAAIGLGSLLREVESLGPDDLDGAAILTHLRAGAWLHRSHRGAALLASYYPAEPAWRALGAGLDLINATVAEAAARHGAVVLGPRLLVPMPRDAARFARAEAGLLRELTPVAAHLEAIAPLCCGRTSASSAVAADWVRCGFARDGAVVLAPEAIEFDPADWT